LVTFHKVTSKIYISEDGFTPDQLSMVSNRFNNLLFSNLVDEKPTFDDLLSERLVRKMKLESELGGGGLLQKRMFPYRRLTKRSGGTSDHKMFAEKRQKHGVDYETTYRKPPGLGSFRSFKKKNSAFKRDRSWMQDAMREASIPSTYYMQKRGSEGPPENPASDKKPASMSQAEWWRTNYIPNLEYMQDKRGPNAGMKEDKDVQEKRDEDHVQIPDNHDKKSGLASSLKSVNPNEFGFSDYDGGLASSYFDDMKKRNPLASSYFDDLKKRPFISGLTRQTQQSSSHNKPIFGQQNYQRQKRHGNGLMRRMSGHQNGFNRQAVRYSVPSPTHGKPGNNQLWYSAKRDHKRSAGDDYMFAKRSNGDDDMFAKRMCVTCSGSENGYFGGQGGGFMTGFDEHGPSDDGGDYYHAYEAPQEYTGYTAITKVRKRNLGTVTFNDIKAGSNFY